MDLLDSLTEDNSNNQIEDLLANLDEGGAPAWVAKEPGDGVQGVVISIDTTKSKFKDKDGNYPDCPVLTLRKADGSEVRVTAYQSILRKEIEQSGVQVGDLFAAKYFGKKPTKNSDGEYHHYKVARRPGAQPAASSTPPWRNAA